MLLFVLCIALWQYDLVVYGLAQARGQLHILSNTRTVLEVMNDPNTPDSTVKKLLLIQQVRNYAVDSLGINDSDNYTTFYDQKGRPSLWVVTAAEQFALKPVEWKFPLLGSFPYKGFFEYDMALKEKAKLDGDSLDTNIGVVGGWSTLGWFKDPILSNMLLRSEGDLSDLIIHELTHGTLFVKDSVDFNENLATFIGKKGARRFLKQVFGVNSKEYIQYEEGSKDSERFTSHILRGTDKLDSLYATFTAQNSYEEKLQKKEELMHSIMSTIDTIAFNNPKRYSELLKYVTPNNAYFLSFVRYRAKLDNFEEELESRFDNDLKAYLQYLKEIYPSI